MKSPGKRIKWHGCSVEGRKALLTSFLGESDNAMLKLEFEAGFRYWNVNKAIVCTVINLVDVIVDVFSAHTHHGGTGLRVKGWKFRGKRSTTNGGQVPRRFCLTGDTWIIFRLLHKFRQPKTGWEKSVGLTDTHTEEESACVIYV